MQNSTTTRLLLAMIWGLSACATGPQSVDAQTSPAQSTPINHPQADTREFRFQAWKKDFSRRAIAKGYDPDLVAQTIAPAKINTLALDRDRDQPEFTKPIWSYVDGAVSAERLNKGRAKLASEAVTYAAISDIYPVDTHILTAIWGLESAYGRVLGTHDIVSALATFAFEGRRTSFGEQQLFAVLDILHSGTVLPEQLIGSWAGAMGMTQFIPTTFRDYAIDFDQDGNKDLWENPADALGSAAHYLARHGWRAHEPAFTEVKLVPDFNYSLSNGTQKSVNEWTALGVAPVSGQKWSDDAGFLTAKLLVPAGHKGPKFLTFKNFDVIKKYNNSTSYALGISTLAKTLKGERAIITPWPRGDAPLSFTDKENLQRRLSALGYDTGGVDGQIGPNSRRAIRAWQRANGYPADGYVEQNLLRKILTPS